MTTITLKVPEPAHAPRIAEAVRESITEISQWQSWCAQSYSVRDAEQWISTAGKGREREQAFEFVILSETGNFLGCCGINQVNKADRFANLGYWIRTAETGRGFATAAAIKLIEFAFAETSLERLEILAALGNVRSQAVAKAAGAKQEGVLSKRLWIHGMGHDAILFSILKPRQGDSHPKS